MSESGERQPAEGGSCPVCGIAFYKLLYPATPIKSRSGSLYYQIGHDDIVQCQVCKMVYVVSSLNGKQSLSEYGMVEVKEYMREEASRTRSFSRWLDFIEAHTVIGSVLDVGCSTGIFLHVARKRGWQVLGLEPSKCAVKFAEEHYGLEVIRGVLPAAELSARWFDVVTLWDVIEHVREPSALLKECWRRIRPEGFLVLSTPNIGSMLAKLLGEKWMWLIRVHLHYFSEETIGLLLQKLGYRLVGIHSQPRFFSLGYLCERIEPFLPAWIHPLFKVFQQLAPNARWMVPIDFHDTMIVIAQKPSVP